MARLSMLRDGTARLAPVAGYLSRDAAQASRDRDAMLSWRKWYKTERWRQLRLGVLARDMYTCRLCGREEGNTALLVADHVQPHRGDAALFWDEGNLQCLCKSCHDGAKQRDERGRGGW